MTVLQKFSSHDLGLITITVSFHVAVAGLALAPSGTVPPLPLLSDKAQHVLAFCFLGLVTMFGRPEPVGFRRAFLSLVVFAAVLELCQCLSPSRTVSFADFLASALGASLGTTVAALALRYRARRNVPDLVRIA